MVGGNFYPCRIGLTAHGYWSDAQGVEIGSHSVWWQISSPSVLTMVRSGWFERCRTAYLYQLEANGSATYLVVEGWIKVVMDRFKKIRSSSQEMIRDHGFIFMEIWGKRFVLVPELFLSLSTWKTTDRPIPITHKTQMIRIIMEQ